MSLHMNGFDGGPSFISSPVAQRRNAPNQGCLSEQVEEMALVSFFKDMHISSRPIPEPPRENPLTQAEVMALVDSLRDQYIKSNAIPEFPQETLHNVTPNPQDNFWNLGGAFVAPPYQLP
jgi:hypothetical protein